MGKLNGRFYKHNRSKLLTPRFKKPVLLSSAFHTSSACNSTQTSISSILDHKHITNNQNKNNISNTDDSQYYVTPKIKSTSTPTHLKPLSNTLPIPFVKLHTTTKLPTAGREYFCFQINGKYSQAAKYIKSRIITKVINYILYIDTFEQQRVFLKGMFQSTCLKDHMKAIGIDQSLSFSASFEHKFLNNIKKIYQHTVRYYDQQKFKNILEDAMVSTPEEIPDDSPSFHTNQTTVKNPTAIKSLRFSPKYLMLTRQLLSVMLETKNKNEELLNLEVVCGKLKKRKVHSKINDHIKHDLYKWITHYPHVLQLPIFNDCLKVIFDDQTQPQIFTKLLIQVYFRELYNNLVSDPNYCGLQETRDKEYNIVIVDSIVALHDQT